MKSLLDCLSIITRIKYPVQNARMAVVAIGNGVIKKFFAVIISVFLLQSAKAQVIISEIDYDNVGTDNNEKIELFGINGTDLTGWSLVLYNGANGLPYNTLNLTGTIPFNCAGSDGIPYGVKVISYAGPDAIQNGAPDGIALVNASGIVVEFLSYEGTFTATAGPATGMLSIDIGVSDGNSNEGSLERHSNNTWTFATTNSFGICNTGLIVSSICAEPDGFDLLATTSNSSVCTGAQVALGIQYNGTSAGAVYNWEYSNASTGYVVTDLGPGQTTPVKITTVTETTEYFCRVTCNGDFVTRSHAVFVSIYTASAITTIFTVDCNAHTTQLSLTGLQAGITHTYQWQKNVNNAGWNNIPAATSSTLSQPTAAYTTAYRCNITACSGATSTTSSEVTPDHGNCYCLPLYYDPCIHFAGTQNLPVRTVSLNTLLNSSNSFANCNQNLYENFLPAGTNTTNLSQGLLYNLQINLVNVFVPINGGSSMAVWIDYNDNYIFETTERITDLRNLTVNLPDGLIVDIPLLVPANAPLGLHRMRIREANQTQGLSVPPCDVSIGQFIDGETEDYSITIVAATACTGGASVGGTVSSNQSICIGATPNPVTLSGNTGNILFWQRSGDAAFTNPTNISVTTSTLNIGPLNSTTYYRAAVQNNNCTPAYSSAVQITVTNITAGTLLATTGQSGGQPPASAGTTYYMDNCKLIASSVDELLATSPAYGGATVTIDGAVQSYNSTPYLQRHYDYGTASPSIGSGLHLTIYCLQSEFTAFNAARGSYKSLPVSGNNSDINIANIRVVKYEGSNPGGGPGSYPPGTTVTTITPAAINWNAAHNWWEIPIGVGGGVLYGDGTGGYFIQSVFDCVPPAVAVSNVSATGATAFWNALPGAAGYEYALQTVNTPPATGTATTGSVVNLSGLTSNTNYYFFIRTNCSADGFSSWASASFFTAITTTAKAGIGTTTPSSNLEVASNGIPDVRISSTNSFGPARLSLLSDKGTANEWRPGYIESGNNGDYTGRLDFYTNGTGTASKFGAVRAMSISNGSLTVTGTVTANGTLLNSDARYKTGISTLPNSLNNLLKLRGTEYFFNKNAFPAMNFSSAKQMGLVAQEVEKIFPELVSTNKEGYKSVNYTGLIPVMIESIKEQQKQIEKLIQQVEELKKMIQK